MNPIRSLMGRRQFLVGSMASASAVAMGNLMKGKGVASAAERRIATSAAQVGGAYTHLLSPLKIRNKVAKNRILYTVSTPYFLMGPETFPPDVIRTYYADIAKSAGIVMVRMSTDMGGGNGPSSGYGAQMPGWNGDDARVHNYIDQMIEGVHAEGGLVGGANIGGGMGAGPGGSTTMTIEEVVTEAKEAEDKGYDVAYVGGRSAASVEDLDPILDKMEAVRNATNLIVVCWVLPTIEGLTQGGGGPGGGAPAGGGGGGGQAPGEAAGGGQMPGGAAGGGMPQGAAGGGQGAPGGGGGQGGQGGGGQGGGPMMGGGSSPTIDDVVAMAKKLDGVADIFQMRDAGSYTSHPNSFNQERGKPNMLLCAEAVKKSGAKILTAPNAGFNDPDLNEEFIASGKTDMVAMARALIADPYYALKLGEGRGEDVTPCVMCNSCHGTSKTEGPWLTFCSVNPKLGLPSSVNAVRPPVVSKKVAVIGGGPAGMKAALVAAERGHKVTLFEKENALGGLQRHTDYCSLKWSFRDFKNHLIKQVEKAGIDVRLGTTATPEMIKAAGYDTVLAALGAEPATSRIPGADGGNVFDIMEAYSKESSMGKDVVLIGGGNYGGEAGISLANAGHNVTAITTAEELMTSGPHDRVGQIGMSQSMDNFTAIVKAMPSKISGGKVYYTDESGKDQSVKADSVVIYGGLNPLQEEAMKFHGSAQQVLLLGDCTGKNGTIQKAIRSAYFMASQV